MNRTHIALVALLITVATTPAVAQMETPETPDSPEANGTTTNETTRTTTSTPTATTRTTTSTPGDDLDEQARTAIPTPPPDSEFAETDSTASNQTLERGERVDSGLILLNSSYDSDDGSVTLTFRAEQTSAVTLIDAGAFERGGELPTRHLDPFEGETTVEMPVYRPEDSRYVGVTIVTSDVRYAEPIEVTPEGFDFPAERHLLALVTGIALVVVSAVVIDKYRGKRREEGVMRVEG